MLLGAWFSFFFFGIVKVGKYALKRTLQVIKLRCQVVGEKKQEAGGYGYQIFTQI